MEIPKCRTCGAGAVRKVGPLPDVWEFAGSRQSVPIPGGNLWRCQSCGLAFRHPLLEPSVYERLYQDGKTDLWDWEDRQDFALIGRHIATLPPGLDVLDIGCYTGQLLASLPGHHRLYGVEPNDAAARIATERGVRVIAASFKDLARVEQSFDVITACDVIEHVPDPLEFLSELGARLRPGGRLMISTGNSDAWLWRLLRSRYWYSYFPEHISFVGSRWFKLMPGRVRLRLLQLVPFNYRTVEISAASLLPLLGAGLYACSPRLCRIVRRMIGSGRNADGPPPGCGASRDHIFCVLSGV
jgi:SAM-dependent methyltransferase